MKARRRSAGRRGSPRWVVGIGALILAASAAMGAGPASGVAGFGDIPSPGEAFYIIPVQWMVENDITTRSEEHTSELQSRTQISYAVFCLKKFFF